MGNVASPPDKIGNLFIGTAVKHVAGDDNLSWLEKLNRFQESVKIILINILWHPYPRFSKMAGFAKMRVRQNQCFFFFPKKTSMR